MPTVIISDNTTGRDFTGVEDLHLNQGSPDLSEGTNTEWQFTKPTGGAGEKNGLLKFSGLSNITGPVTVSAVTLSLWQVNTQTGEALLYRCLRDWDELSGSWNNYDTNPSNLPWGTAGAKNTTSDRSSTLTQSITKADTSGAYQDFTGGAQMIADVQNWINGVNSNFGWVKELGSVADGTQHVWHSSEGTDGQRPKLTVVYETAGAPHRPISDVSVTGWSSTGASVFSVIDEGSPDDADYATSPAITGSGSPAIMGLSSTPLAAGTWAVAVRAATSTGSATMRVKLLNDSNAQQGVVDQAVTSTPTRYNLTIVTSGAATRISFEFFT